MWRNMKEIIKKSVNENTLYIYKTICPECGTEYTFEYRDLDKSGIFGYWIDCPSCRELEHVLILKTHRYKKKTKQCPDCGCIISDHEERCDTCRLSRAKENWDELWRKTFERDV